MKLLKLLVAPSSFSPLQWCCWTLPPITVHRCSSSAAGDFDLDSDKPYRFSIRFFTPHPCWSGCQDSVWEPVFGFLLLVKIRFSLGKPASQSTVPAPPPASCALATTWLPGRPAEEEEEEEEVGEGLKGVRIDWGEQEGERNMEWEKAKEEKEKRTVSPERGQQKECTVRNSTTKFVQIVKGGAAAAQKSPPPAGCNCTSMTHQFKISSRHFDSLRNIMTHRHHTSTPY